MIFSGVGSSMNSWGLVSSSKGLALSLKIYLWLVVGVVGIICNICESVQVFASEKQQNTIQSTRGKILLAQSTVVIAGVKANHTDKGVEVILYQFKKCLRQQYCSQITRVQWL